MKKRPEEIKLSRDEGEALIGRLESDRLSVEDRTLLVKLIELYFWLTYALQETKISLKRLKVALFGQGRGKGQEKAESSAGGGSGGGAGEGGASGAGAGGRYGAG